MRSCLIEIMFISNMTNNLNIEMMFCINSFLIKIEILRF